MREVFAHEALVDLEPQADDRALGAAVTVALCGHWEHEPPCPVAPHHSNADRVGDQVRVRTLFATDPDAEDDVRRRIDDALAAGELQGPDGVTTRWRLRSSGPSAVAADETAHGQRLLNS